MLIENSNNIKFHFIDDFFIFIALIQVNNIAGVLSQLSFRGTQQSRMLDGFRCMLGFEPSELPEVKTT